MDSQKIKYKIRDLRSDLYFVQKKILYQMYLSNYDYYHPSLKHSLDQIFILDQVIEGYINLLNQTTDIESEMILKLDIPKEKWFDK